MSETSYPDLIKLYEAAQVFTSIGYGMTALVFYEYIITIGQESSLVWRRRWSTAVWVFIANRYLMIANSILQSVPIYSSVECHAVSILGLIVVMAQYPVTGLFSAMRVYALWDRSIYLACPVFVLNLLPLAALIFNTSQLPIVYIDQVCTTSGELPRSVNLGMLLMARVGLILADLLVLALTWTKTYRNCKIARKVSIHVQLSELLLRDGAIYFLALLVINIAQIIVKSLPSSSGFSPVIAVSDALPPVLISRCLLNLWQAGQLEGDSSSATSHFTTLKFGSPNVVNTRVEFSSALDNPGDLDCDSEYGDKAVDWDGFDDISSDNIHGKENYSGVEFI